VGYCRRPLLVDDSWALVVDNSLVSRKHIGKENHRTLQPRCATLHLCHSSIGTQPTWITEHHTLLPPAQLASKLELQPSNMTLTGTPPPPRNPPPNCGCHQVLPHRETAKQTPEAELTLLMSQRTCFWNSDEFPSTASVDRLSMSVMATPWYLSLILQVPSVPSSPAQKERRCVSMFVLLMYCPPPLPPSL